MANEFVARNGVFAQNNSQVTGSLIVTNGITGSLFGTSSFATLAATASYFVTSSVTSASFATSASYASSSTSSSYALNATSSSFASLAATASYFLTSSVTSASFATSASYAATSSFASDFTVANTLTATTLVVQTVSSSVVYSSGSNIFGNSLSNTQKFTGSVQITGSLLVNDVVTASIFVATNNGNGTNFKVGDDAWIGDINLADTIAIRGQQNSANGFISFGATDASTLLGRTGAGPLTWGGATILTTANFFTGSARITGSLIVTGSTSITGITAIGTTNTSNEANLFLGALNATEGGQIILQKGTAQASASMLDNYANAFRVLTGTDTASNRSDLELSHVTRNLTIYGDVIAYGASDKRLKENVQPIPNALDKLDKIGGYMFNWNNQTDIHGHEGHDVGVIAQEIESILPEIVTTRDNGYKAVKYEKIVPLLIQCIKELKDEIRDLKSQK